MESGDEEGKCGLEVDTVGGEDHVWLGWDLIGDWLPPI